MFEVDGEIVAYAECSYEVVGSDNWINPRCFEKRDMRPLFVDELAVHPDMHGRGVGSLDPGKARARRGVTLAAPAAIDNLLLWLDRATRSPARRTRARAGGARGAQGSR